MGRRHFLGFSNVCVCRFLFDVTADTRIRIRSHAADSMRDWVRQVKQCDAGQGGKEGESEGGEASRLKARQGKQQGGPM